MRAIVTPRMRPLQIEGRTVHQVACPSTGATTAANELIVLSGDPNVSIEEAKAFTCAVRKGRRSGDPGARLEGVHDPPPDVAPNRDHPAEEPHG